MKIPMRAILVLAIFAIAIADAGCVRGGTSSTGGQLQPEGARGIPDKWLIIEAVGPRSDPYVGPVGFILGFKNGEPQSEFIITSASDNWELPASKIAVPGVKTYYFDTPGTYKYQIEWLKGPAAGKTYVYSVEIS
jgi:hypothetical protein|tara:strand:- start:841 stop:1245 length:405 start_codon:yes stop_codon:yes gene_type:complete